MTNVPSPHDRFDASDDGAVPRGGGLTRRRVVSAGAVVGAAAVLGTLPAGAAARGSTGALTVSRAALTPGRTTGPLRAPHRFDLLGAPVAALDGVGLEVRARPVGGRWSAWHGLSAHDGHAPDGRRSVMSDPLWFGDADEVELRARRRPDRDVRLELVVVNGAAKRAAGRAASRAVAAGGVPLRASRTRATGGTGATARSAPTIIPRSAWAAGLTPRAAPDFGAIQVAFVHHTVNGNTYAREESAGIVRAIYDYHVRSNGWNDIGYNFLVDRFGQIFEGRAGGIDQPVVGAQAIGWNSVSTGIAIIGTFESVAAPDAALAAVASIIGWKLPLHGVPTAGTVSLVSSGGSGNRWKAGATVAMNRVSGHQDGCSTDCPGATLYGQLPALRSRVGNVQPAAAADALTIQPPSAAVRWGETATVSGRVTGAAVAGVTVVLDKRSPTGKWVPVAQTASDADGTWSVGFALRSATAVRARTDAATSPAVTPTLDPGLDVTAPTTRPRAGGSMLVRGRARGVKDVKLVLRRKVGGRYAVVASTTVRVKNGRFSGRLPVRRAGMHNVSVQTTSGGRAFRSAKRFVRAR